MSMASANEACKLFLQRIDNIWKLLVTDVANMLRFKIKEMIARREFEEGRRITIAEVAEGAGIHRVTLSKMINRRGFSTSTEHIDGLCRYFECKVDDLIEYVPDELVRDLDEQGTSS